MSECVFVERRHQWQIMKMFWLLAGLKKQEGSCADGEYAAIPLHKMQTCSSPQMSLVVLEKEGVLVPLSHCSLPLLA